MPIMDGYTATTKIRNNPETENIKVMALTASAMTHSEDDIRLLCDDYLKKPVSGPELIAHISTFLKHSVQTEYKMDKPTIILNSELPEGLKIQIQDIFNNLNGPLEALSINEMNELIKSIKSLNSSHNCTQLDKKLNEMTEYAYNYDMKHLIESFMSLKG